MCELLRRLGGGRLATCLVRGGKWYGGRREGWLMSCERREGWQIVLWEDGGLASCLLLGGRVGKLSDGSKTLTWRGLTVNNLTINPWQCRACFGRNVYLQCTDLSGYPTIRLAVGNCCLREEIGYYARNIKVIWV